jgi:transcriptional regulator with XRE-family HTH domain
MDWKQKLGKELRRARETRRMTQQELRDALLRNGLSLSLPTIGYYERGERAPNFDDLRNFAAVLKADYFEIDDHLRIEFRKNGKPHVEPVAQQLNLDFDDNGGVTIRIEPVRQGLIIKKTTVA